MSDKRPTVSIFMPTYMHEHLISEAIESVLNQTYDDWGLVIGDDCSTDRTYEIVQSYQARFPEKIVAFKNSKNLGITGNFNEILKKCTGKYIAFCAGDDVFLPEKLSKQVALMEGNPDCLMSYHDLEVFDSESGQTLHYWNSGKRRPKPIQGDADYMLKKLVEHTAGFMGALSVMIRRSALPKNAVYDERLPITSELSMWPQVLRNNKGTMKFMPEVLARYRKHDGGVTSNSKAYETEINVFLAIIEREYPVELLPSVTKARCRMHYSIGVENVLDKNYKSATTALLVSLRSGIHSLKIFYWLARAIARI